MVMLMLLLVQAGTGLCANDDISAEGPLAHFAGQEWSNRLSAVHSFNFTLIEIAVGLHLVAIAAYRVLKGHDLVRPMITGWKVLPEAAPEPRMARPAAALAIFVMVAALVTAGVRWLSG